MRRMPLRIDAPLGAAKHRLHIVPAPAGIASCAPCVEVSRHATAIDHGVNGARPTHHLATRPVAALPRQRRLGLALVSPVDALVEKGASVTNGQLDPEAPVTATGFQQQDVTGRG